MKFGIDHAASPPSPSALKLNGVEFVCRYVSTPGNPKNLTRDEVLRLRAHQLDIVVVFETTAQRALGGYVAGVADAKAARSQTVELGLPDAPVYFAVDFDANPPQQVPISAYFDGAVSVLGFDNVGAYGGYWVIKRLADAEKCRYFWQTYAWSGGQWDKRAHLRQYENSKTFCGIECDFDHALAADFGQAVAPLIRRLRVWALAERARGVIWAALKKMPNWIRYRKLGGT